jgi:hypothetical protein
VSNRVGRRAGRGWFLPEWFLVVFAQKPLLCHMLGKWFLISIVVFAIYLRPRLYLWYEHKATCLHNCILVWRRDEIEGWNFQN